MKSFAIRLKLNEDLKLTLKKFAIQQNIQAGFILTAIGSLKQAKIRLSYIVGAQHCCALDS